MSILIKGVDMPKDDEILSINIYPNGKVCINLDLKCNQIATAIPISTPHGRLIDCNKLEEDIKKYHLSNGKYQHWAQVQPTVIEAEE